MLAVLVFKTICYSLENSKGRQARLDAENGTPLCIRHDWCSSYCHVCNFYNAHIHVMWLIYHITFQRPLHGWMFLVVGLDGITKFSRQLVSLT